MQKSKFVALGGNSLSLVIAITACPINLLGILLAVAGGITSLLNGVPKTILSYILCLFSFWTIGIRIGDITTIKEKTKPKKIVISLNSDKIEIEKTSWSQLDYMVDEREPLDFDPRNKCPEEWTKAGFELFLVTLRGGIQALFAWNDQKNILFKFEKHAAKNGEIQIEHAHRESKVNFGTHLNEDGEVPRGNKTESFKQTHFNLDKCPDWAKLLKKLKLWK